MKRAVKRTPTQKANPNWPFLYSLVPGRGLVQNVPVPPKQRVKLLRRRIPLRKPVPE